MCMCLPWCAAASDWFPSAECWLRVSPSQEGRHLAAFPHLTVHTPTSALSHRQPPSTFNIRRSPSLLSAPPPFDGFIDREHWYLLLAEMSSCLATSGWTFLIRVNKRQSCLVIYRGRNSQLLRPISLRSRYVLCQICLYTEWRKREWCGMDGGCCRTS